MNQNFTNDLIRLAYKETNLTETLQLVEVIENDSEVKHYFGYISGVKNDLDQISHEPSDASIDFILKYSQKRAIYVSWIGLEITAEKDKIPL